MIKIEIDNVILTAVAITMTLVAGLMWFAMKVDDSVFTVGKIQGTVKRVSAIEHRLDFYEDIFINYEIYIKLKTDEKEEILLDE
jgi:hypothetical protein